MRFPRIPSEVFLNHANKLDGGHSTGHAGHPVPSRDTEQLLMHQEAIGEAVHPAQTGSIALDADRVSVPFTVYAGTDFQEVPARSADIRLLRCALLASARRRTNKASAGTRTSSAGTSSRRTAASNPLRDSTKETRSGKTSSRPHVRRGFVPGFRQQETAPCECWRSLSGRAGSSRSQRSLPR